MAGGPAYVRCAFAASHPAERAGPSVHPRGVVTARAMAAGERRRRAGGPTPRRRGARAVGGGGGKDGRRDRKGGAIRRAPRRQALACLLACLLD
eukprot:scaffold1486_cov329-Prasinococcus_capsulatus_cf.AAC.2